MGPIALFSHMKVFHIYTLLSVNAWKIKDRLLLFMASSMASSNCCKDGYWAVKIVGVDSFHHHEHSRRWISTKSQAYANLMMVVFFSVINNRSMWIWEDMCSASPVVWWVCSEVSGTGPVRGSWDSNTGGWVKGPAGNAPLSFLGHLSLASLCVVR